MADRQDQEDQAGPGGNEQSDQANVPADAAAAQAGPEEFDRAVRPETIPQPTGYPGAEYPQGIIPPAGYAQAGHFPTGYPQAMYPQGGNQEDRARARYLQTGPPQADYPQREHHQAAQGQAAPSQAAPGQAAPGQAAPSQAAPGQAAPGQAAPGQAAPGQAAQDYNLRVPDQIDPNLLEARSTLWVECPLYGKMANGHNLMGYFSLYRHFLGINFQDEESFNYKNADSLFRSLANRNNFHLLAQISDLHCIGQSDSVLILFLHESVLHNCIKLVIPIVVINQARYAAPLVGSLVQWFVNSNGPTQVHRSMLSGLFVQYQRLMELLQRAAPFEQIGAKAWTLDRRMTYIKAQNCSVQVSEAVDNDFKYEYKKALQVAAHTLLTRMASQGRRDDGLPSEIAPDLQTDMLNVFRPCVAEYGAFRPQPLERNKWDEPEVDLAQLHYVGHLGDRLGTNRKIQAQPSIDYNLHQNPMWLYNSVWNKWIKIIKISFERDVMKINVKDDIIMASLGFVPKVKINKSSVDYFVVNHLGWSASLTITRYGYGYLHFVCAQEEKIVTVVASLMKWQENNRPLRFYPEECGSTEQERAQIRAEYVTLNALARAVFPNCREASPWPVYGSFEALTMPDPGHNRPNPGQLLQKLGKRLRNRKQIFTRKLLNKLAIDLVNRDFSQGVPTNGQEGYDNCVQRWRVYWQVRNELWPIWNPVSTVPYFIRSGRELTNPLDWLVELLEEPPRA